ncbi:MAG TPA: alpha/beta hydrolase-fold protein [Verrucomicrobiae bacterium]|nr:alpha/beta hydrolase-fold protein [Verrucomicrobiae bacterium]
MASFSETLGELAGAGPGRLRKHEQFRSRYLSAPRDVVVYLPGVYDKRPDLRFPVLYLQDGQNLFDPATSFVPGVDWRVGQTADSLIEQGDIQPLIIVGIYNTGKKRISEYTPSRDRKLGGGGADRYARMLLKEMKPFIESEYRALGDASNTGLGGSSLGGLLTIYLGLKFPQVFGKLAVLSPSVWWNQRWILDFAARRRLKSRPRIWLDVGTDEGGRTLDDVRKLSDVLLQKGWKDDADLDFEVVPGGQHNEAAWAQRVGPFLQFLFPGGKPAV